MTEDQYNKAVEFVKNGGQLLLSSTKYTYTKKQNSKG